jgi:hypothetical protein
VTRGIAATARLHRSARQASAGNQGGHQQHHEPDIGNCANHSVLRQLQSAYHHPSPAFSTARIRPTGGFGSILGYPVTRMPRARHIVLLAIVLLFANTWCVAQCSIAPAPGHLPPCHRQHQTVKPCATPVLVEAPHSPAPSPLALLGVAPQAAVDPVVSTRQLDPPPAFVSPPAPPIATPLRA